MNVIPKSQTKNDLDYNYPAHRSKKLEQTKLEEVVDRQKWDMTMYLGPSRQACAGDSVLVQKENLASPTTVGHLGSV